MIFSAQLHSQNFGHLLSLECLREWARDAGVALETVDLDDPEALTRGSADERRPFEDELFVLGPGSLFLAGWVPAFARLEEAQQRRRFAWYTGLVSADAERVPKSVESADRRQRMRRVLYCSGQVVVRWPQEAQWLREQFDFRSAVVGSDPALLAPCRVETCRTPTTPGDNRVLLALNAYNLDAALKKEQLTQVAKLAARLRRRGLELEFLAGESCDRGVGRALLGDLPDESMPLGLEERRRQVERAALVVSERLHPLLYAVSQHVPFVALTYHAKVEHFLGALGMLGQAVETRDRVPTVDELDEVVTRSLEAADSLRERLIGEATRQRERALAALARLQEEALQPRALVAPSRVQGAPRARPTIAHCLTVRNEPRRLRELLELTRPHVDEILVWDDASANGRRSSANGRRSSTNGRRSSANGRRSSAADTAEAARDLADRVFTSTQPAYCPEYYLGALQSLARSEWILFLSPDAVPGAHLFESLPQLVTEPGVGAYTFEIWLRDPSGDTKDHSEVRLVRNGAAHWWPLPHVAPEVEGVVVDTDVRLFLQRDWTPEWERAEESRYLRGLRVVRRELRNVWRPRGDDALALQARCRQVLVQYYPGYSPSSSFVAYRAPGSSIQLAEHVHRELSQALGDPWRVLDWEEAKETPSGNPLVEADALVVIGAGPDHPLWREIERECHRLFAPIVLLDCAAPGDLAEALEESNRWALPVPATRRLRES